MAKKKQKGILKGNRLWAMGHAVTSLKNYRIRNFGIALVLAICVAIPTSVFAWTNTGTRLAVEDYFSNNAYQFSIQNKPYNRDYQDLIDVQELVMASPYTESAVITPSTVGILRMDWITPEWESYRTDDQNYAFGKKDTRVIVASQEILDVWIKELSWTGNFTLNTNRILVSQNFIDTTLEVTGEVIGINSTISIDLLRNYYAPPTQVPFDPLRLNRIILRNLTISGVYEVVTVSVVGQSFPSLTRTNWDPLGIPSSVLGIRDSVIIMDETLDAESIDMIATRGFFSPVEFIRGSASGLIKAGPASAATNMLSLRAQIIESNEDITVVGLDGIEDLQVHISTYLASQTLIILAIPIMVMSLMLTIFTSETSVAQKRGEVSALRTKGASFNQIFSAFIFEALILALVGYIIGIGLTILIAPLMGSSTGLLSFDSVLYETYLTNLMIPNQALALAATIAMFLPAAYLVHVARRIDVTEIGQPATRMPYEIPEEANIWFYVLALGGTLATLLLMPILINPVGQIALIQILLSTLMLFAASYLGSRAMRLVTATASERVGNLMGEKKLYLTQSLRRRKSQFLPLLVILTLTLTTTTMMLIQTASFETTLVNEANYSLGCDVRIDGPSQNLDWADTIRGFDGVDEVTPVLELLSFKEYEGLYLEGIDPLAYLQIGTFRASSFVGASPEEVLGALAGENNGIVISEFYLNDWNASIGDAISLEVPTEDGGGRPLLFEIVGVMKSAPGFGLASTHDLGGVPFGSYFGFQPGSGGFALVNLDYLSTSTGFITTDEFLISATSLADVEPLIQFLESNPYRTVYTPENIEFASNSVTGLFLAGIEGLTMISFIMCAAMGISSIVLFLGSAVMEREPEYALFRAVGGTKRQVVSLVFGEFAGSVMAAVVISLGLGVLFGYVMTLLTFGISSVWPILPTVFTYPFTIMFLTIAIECVAMIAACYFPARRAGNTDPADVLRNM
jgi:ABC-type lipoprotein release transport system permease subunit